MPDVRSLMDVAKPTNGAPQFPRRRPRQSRLDSGTQLSLRCPADAGKRNTICAQPIRSLVAGDLARRSVPLVYGATQRMLDARFDKKGQRFRRLCVSGSLSPSRKFPEQQLSRPVSEQDRCCARRGHFTQEVRQHLLCTSI